jgi:enterochelin esterase-like enzyme
MLARTPVEPTPSNDRLSDGMRPVIPRPAPTTVQTVLPLPGRLSRQIAHGGYLENATLGVVILGFAVTLVAAWMAVAVARHRRGRRLVPRVPRWAANTAAAVATSVLVVVGSAVLVNSYAGYVPNLGDLRTQPGTTLAAGGALGTSNGAARSEVVRVNLPDHADGVKVGTTYVYLPPGYDTPANANRRYPTIYLIHGYPGHAADWFVAGRAQHTLDLLIRDHYIGPMIVVAPTASMGFLQDDECLDAAGHFRLETYLAVHVVDTIDHLFRTIPQRSYRAIGGMSSGGYCALNLGVHHLHRFGVILASEPYADPGGGPRQRLLADNWALFRADSPSFCIPLWRFNPPVAVFLDSGGADRNTTWIAHNLALMFASRGQVVAYREAPHQHHTWREARAELAYSLIFAWHEFGRIPAGGSDRADARELAAVLAYARGLRAPATALPSPIASPVPSPGSHSPARRPSPTATPDRTPTPSRSPSASPTATSPSSPGPPSPTVSRPPL